MVGSDTVATTRASPWRRVLSALGVDLRPGEGGVAVLLFFCFFLFITFQYATKSVRQSTFIDGRGAAELPWVYLSVALVSYPFLLLYSRLANRLPRHRLILGTSVVIAASMVVCWWLFRYSAPWLPYVFYVWISLVYVMNVSQFWAFSANVLDPRQAKRLYGFVGAGGLLGGVAGGQVAKLVAKVADTRATFLVAGGILLAATWLIRRVHRLRPDAAEPAPDPGLAKLEKARGGLAILRGSRHLQCIGAIVVLMTIVAQVVDLQFNWAAEQATSGLDERTAFFGNFYTVMGVSAFLFQVLFTSRIHRRLGVGVALRASPVTMGLGTVLLLAAAVASPAALLPAALLLKVGENGLRYSVDQATRELLFMPIPSQLRVKAKAFIDVFMARGAKGLAALLLLPVTFGIFTAVQAGWIALALIGVWLALTVVAHREYVRSFRRSLKERSMETELPVNLSDVTTLEVLVQALGSPDSRQVLQALDILAANGRAGLVPPVLLHHDDPEVRRRTLDVLALAGRRDAADLVERRLADPDADVRAEAVRVLAELRGREARELMLPRLREASPAVRAAAIACLARYGEESEVALAAATLAELAGDADPAARREAANAIGGVPEPRFRESLVRLLYDPDPEVARAAIAAVRHRAQRDGHAPHYGPILVALLQRRALKHDAREAIVALGEPMVPVLRHFLADPEEPLWVRRALPKTLAALGSPGAAAALLEGLQIPGDRFLRAKVIEALGSLPTAALDAAGRGAVGKAIAGEVAAYLQALADLLAVGLPAGARLVGPTVHGSAAEEEPNLLQALLAERLEEHLHNLFGLLALLYPARDVWAAHRSVASGDPALVSRTLEYLENLLAGDLRRKVFAVVGDMSIAQKLRWGQLRYGIHVEERSTVFDGLLRAPAGEDDRGAAMAALYVGYAEGVEAVRARLANLASAADPWVAETAQWVSARWPQSRPGHGELH